ncbi:hypothetical protein NH8B_1393 [Pseudogulbenkiania sp. NH8B]|nr:hypothetical protein NH8B_1393 [Pseudogulbenkiania sp. NH8B]
MHEAVSANVGSSDRFLPQTDTGWRVKTTGVVATNAYEIIWNGLAYQQEAGS